MYGLQTPRNASRNRLTDPQWPTKEEDIADRVTYCLLGDPWQTTRDEQLHPIHELLALHNSFPNDFFGWRKQRSLPYRVLAIALYLTTNSKGKLVSDPASNTYAEPMKLYEILGHDDQALSSTIRTIVARGKVLAQWCREFGVGILLAPDTLAFNQ